jgi:hypothetical protein
MTKRTETIKFCQYNGLRAKGDRTGVMLSYDTRRLSHADWADCFETWDEAHAFLLAAVEAHTYHDKPYPWMKS